MHKSKDAPRRTARNVLLQRATWEQLTGRDKSIDRNALCQILAPRLSAHEAPWRTAALDLNQTSPIEGSSTLWVTSQPHAEHCALLETLSLEGRTGHSRPFYREIFIFCPLRGSPSSRDLIRGLRRVASVTRTICSGDNAHTRAVPIGGDTQPHMAGLSAVLRKCLRLSLTPAH